MNLQLVGDIIAIPFFFWLVLYFYKRYKNSGFTKEEKILALFCLGGLIADLYFVCILS
jgi:hypothetical protein